MLKVLNGVMLLLDFDPKQFLLDMLSFRGNQVCHFNFFSMMMLGFLFCTLTGEKETEVHMLRSILVQMVISYDNMMMMGFLLLHVPEVHPETGTTFFEREDEGHVLKVHKCIHIVLCSYLAISYMHVVFVHLWMDLYLLSPISCSLYSHPTPDCMITLHTCI